MGVCRARKSCQGNQSAICVITCLHKLQELLWSHSSFHNREMSSYDSSLHHFVDDRELYTAWIIKSADVHDLWAGIHTVYFRFLEITEDFKVLFTEQKKMFLFTTPTASTQLQSCHLWQAEHNENIIRNTLF